MLRSPRLALLALLLLVAAILGWHRLSISPHSATTAAGASSLVTSTDHAPAPITEARPDFDGFANPAALRADTLHRLAYAQAWDRELPAAMAAFRAWTERYRAAAPAARHALEAEGVALAHARRAEMLDLIKTDPAHALAVTIPAVVRAQLPPAVLGELEARVAGRGDFALNAGIAEPGGVPAQRRRIAFVGGVEYTAHAYGRRRAQLTKEGASLHGVALDGQLALHESPLRVLEPGETLAAAIEDLHCPVSGSALAAIAPGTGVNTAALNVGAAFGRTWEFCDADPAMLARFEQRLTADEDGIDPRVAPPGTPRVEADAPTSRTSGAQRVLVIRADFSDVPGAPVLQSDAQTTMDTIVKPFYENSSYGVTTLTTTVSANVYRLPQTGAAYAAGGLNTQLHTDARNLAAADYTLANFDRIIVIFPRLTLLPNSQINYSGLGSVGGSSVWLNGTFALRNVAHELGHTYGLEHANLWEVSDNNPVSPNGRSVEYNDPFDPMSSGSTDTRFDFSMWAKNHLGWLPDSAVTTATKSGTYRIYRFDHVGAAALNQPLALRIYRDGVRWYWIGLRQNFTTNASLTNGAYVTWGFNNLQQTSLVGLTAPYYNGDPIPSTTFAAGLAVGSTFNDSAYGITIKPTARGGTDPAQYLDIEITLSATPPNTIAAWGENGVLFRDIPEVETNVPTRVTGAIAVASGDYHVLALKADGSVDAWGDNTSKQINVPSGLTGNVASIAAGNSVSAVVKRDGTVQLWGDNTFGQLNAPPGLSGVRQLAIGRNHVLAVKTDGTVVAWGTNTNGQTNVPVGLNDAISVAAGTDLSVALKRDGTVARWGVFSTTVPFPTGLSGVTAISALGVGNGGQFVAALKSDGTVVAWGANNTNQCAVPTGLNNVVAIAAGAFHTLALKSDGTIVAWGSNTSNKCNVPTSLPRPYALAVGNQASFALIGSATPITAPPQSQSVAAGGSVTLGITVSGYVPVSYQWRKNGVAIAGATASTLTLTNFSASDATSYDVALTFAGGAAPMTSSAAALTLATGDVASNPPRLINLSILTPLAANETMTMGTVLGGGGTSGSKPLLVRAVGPSLSQLGVTGVLPDPSMTINSTATSPAVVVGTNNDWGGTTALINAFTAVGAFPYAGATSKDAAVFSTFPAGPYTVQVTGGTGSGTVIAELYDSTPTGTFTATTPRLVNVSVLKQLGSGQTLTAGFVVGGTGQKQILIRAVGPGLTQLGVGGAMADPKLTLFQAGASTSLTSNDDWGGSATLTAAFTSVGAFQLNAQSKDAAIVIPLSPGNYTAQVTGVNGSFGLALVEVYEVP